MKLTAVSISRPLAVSMGILALVILGAIAHSRLAVDLLPDVSSPFVSVTIAYPGASPTDVETLVTKPVEDALAGLPHVSHINSSSVEGASRINVQFADGTNVDLAAIDVERAVNAIRSGLPSDTQAPQISKFDTSQIPVMLITVAGDRPQDQLFNIADQVVKPRLEAVDGVAAVQLFGGLDRQVDVQVDPAKLRAYRVTLAQVTHALGQGNQNQPTGSIEQGTQRYDVRVVGEARTPEQLGEIVINPGAGATVKIKDVAQVTDTFKDQTVLTRANGHAAVAMSIYKQSTSNTVQVADNVKKAAAELQKSGIPAGVQIGTMFDNSITTRQSLNDVNQNLIAAIILCGAVLLLFLHSFRSTIIVLLAIPTSLISTYAVMYALGFTLNMLSLMALALLIGILVDDSIVVLENITRHIELGEQPRAAALIGRTEIGLAAIAITFVDVVVYTPVAYMSGEVGAFFRQFGLTITAATLFSLMVSFTLTPMLASRWLRRHDSPRASLWSRFGHGWDAMIAALARRYGAVVAWAIRRTWRRLLVVVVGIGALAGALALVPLGMIGNEFIPATDEGLFTVNLEMPTGTSLAGTSAVMQRLEQIVQKLPEVDQTVALVGAGGDGGGSQSRFGTIYVQLKPKAQRHRSDAQLAQDVQDQAKGIAGAKVNASTVGFGGTSGTPTIQYRIQGSDTDQLSRIGDQVAAAMATVPGTAHVQNLGAANLPEVRIEADQQRLADLGLTTGDLASTVRTALQGTVATQYQPAGQAQVDVLVQLAPDSRVDPQQLLSLPLASQNGGVVTLGQVATMATVNSPSIIRRADRQRQITVQAQVVDRSFGQVNADVQKRLDQIALPPGYRFVAEGNASDQADAFAALLGALGLSVVLMYMLMVALYESLITPFVIMFSLPMALIGALVALALTGNTLNVFSMIGMIMLMGLVAKNAILLVDFTNTLRRRGVARAEAIRQAGQTRLRPILMTTATMVLGMTPLALKIGQGSELRSSMGVVLIGGLISSLLLTLLLVPVMYTLSEDAIGRLGRFGGWLLRPFRRPSKGEPEPPSVPALDAQPEREPAGVR